MNRGWVVFCDLVGCLVIVVVWGASPVEGSLTAIKDKPYKCRQKKNDVTRLMAMQGRRNMEVGWLVIVVPTHTNNHQSSSSPTRVAVPGGHTFSTVSEMMMMSR